MENPNTSPEQKEKSQSQQTKLSAAADPSVACMSRPHSDLKIVLSEVSETRSESQALATEKYVSITSIPCHRISTAIAMIKLITGFGEARANRLLVGHYNIERGIMNSEHTSNPHFTFSWLFDTSYFE